MFDRQALILWVEEYLFYPRSILQIFLAFLLYPLSLVYTTIVTLKRIYSPKIKPPIAVVSIGNLTIGGSGKTPFLIALAHDYKDAAIILRGYGRKSKGLHLITPQTPIEVSGDEAMLYAQALPNAFVIVSEDRLKALHYAHSLGCKIAFLDDGFSKAHILKYDILIKPRPEPRFDFTLPSGAYREPKFLYKNADLVVEENVDFKRVVKIQNPTERMILITAISKPHRLDAYLPDGIIKKIYFRDHYMYAQKELEALLQKYQATSILTTQKDAVKMYAFGLPLSIMQLHVEINPAIKEQIKTFLSDFR